MGDEPPQLAAGIHWDDPQCRLMGGVGWLERTEGVEGGNGVVAVCGSKEVYRGSLWVP